MFFLPEEIDFPQDLNDKIVRAIFDGGKPEPKLYAERLKKLWPLLAKGRGQEQSKNHYGFDSQLVRTYASYYLTANALKPAAVLEEMRLLGLDISSNPDLKTNWLDFGCGPGTLAWGLDWWSTANDIRNIDYYGFDQSKNFSELGSSFASSMQIRNRYDILQKTSAKTIIELLTKHNAHVVSFMNSVAEIFPDFEQRAKAIEEIISAYIIYTQSKQEDRPRWLIFIEPGSQESSRELLSLRDRLLKNPNLKVWLPCFSKRPCGALAKLGDWCHEDVRIKFPDWHDKLGNEAGLRKESMLFSYLVISVGRHPDPVNWYERTKRVVSQRIEEKGLTKCFVCTENGKQMARVVHSKTTDENADFKNGVVRGDLFDDLILDEKGSVETFRRVATERTTVFQKPR